MTGDFLGGRGFWGGRGPLPNFLCTNLLVRVKLGYPPNFNFLGQLEVPLKYVHGRKRRKNNAKFSGHYVHPRTHNVHAHALRLPEPTNKQNLRAGVPPVRSGPLAAL